MKNAEELDTQSSFGTSWKNAPSVADLKADYDAARSIHDTQVSKIGNWLANLAAVPEDDGTKYEADNPFTSRNKVKPSKGRSTVRPKLIRKQAEWRYTSLSEPFLNTVDIFNIDPVTAEDVHSAKQNELILNNQFNTRIDKVGLIDTYVRACVNEGTAILRTGWVTETETQTNEYPIYELVPVMPDNKKTLDKLHEAATVDPRGLPKEVLEALMLTEKTGLPHWPKQTGTEKVTEEVTIKNYPTVEVCDPENIIIDPSCGSKFEDARFVVYSFETSLDELRKSDLYTNLDKIQVTQQSVLADPDHKASYADSGFTFKDKPRQRIIAYEYWGSWDIDDSGKTTPIVATFIGDTMIRLEENPYPDKQIPFVVVPYLPVKDSVYGEPDGALLEDNQNILGAVQRGMIDVMARSANGQIGMRKDALDVINRRKYERGQDYEFNPGVDPRQAVIEHTYPELPRSAFEMLIQQNNEAESMSGVKAFNQGITGAGLGATAAAANGALGAAARRELGILRRLSEGMKRVARKIIAMNQAFLTEDEMVRVTNQEFISIRTDDLSGNFDLRITVSTAEADEQKAQELSFMLQTTGQQFGLEMYKIILAEIADLRKMPQLAAQIRAYAPQPDPMAQALQEQEVLKAQLENAKLQAEIAKIYAEANTAQAKQINTQAHTDKLNLDYVEQEAGVTQERALQKDKAQAKGNMELAMLKSELSPKSASTI